LLFFVVFTIILYLAVVNPKAKINAEMELKENRVGAKWAKYIRMGWNKYLRQNSELISPILKYALKVVKTNFIDLDQDLQKFGVSQSTILFSLLHTL
jgi:hypothetical protein